MSVRLLVGCLTCVRTSARVCVCLLLLSGETHKLPNRTQAQMLGDDNGENVTAALTQRYLLPFVYDTVLVVDGCGNINGMQKRRQVKIK